MRRFEDLIAWQKARVLTKAVYEMTRCGPFARDLRLGSQMQSAAVSIMSNIAEGFERDSLKEYVHFLSLAKASCGELRAQLYVAADVGYLSQEQSAQYIRQTEEVSRLISGLSTSLRRTQANTSRPT